MPALALVLSIGVAAGQPGPAALAAGGAFTSGFGAFQHVTNFRIAPMLLASLVMALATAVGTLLGVDPPLYALAVGLGAFSLGLAASFGTGPWWVLLQGAVFLVLASSRPAGLQDAADRALLVLGGGLVQSFSVSALRTLVPRGFPPLSAPNATPPPQGRVEWEAQGRRVFRLGSPEMRYAVVLGLATAGAVLLEQHLRLSHGYWVALTVLLVLRRGGTETVVRGLQRIVGTLVGAGAATLIAALLRPEPPALILLIAAAAWCAYAAQWVNYGTFSAGVTSFIILLFSLGGPLVAGDRVVATILGGVLGMAALALDRLGGRAARLSG
ncbi:FUSC family protein [Phenylobacterium sp. LjRoot219]|uniref:FUSC family protein n=1 Tax=Phenylobacterium sp. LjRoot219 TaxID=3342283 RepID=UPI003ECCE191